LSRLPGNAIFRHFHFGSDPFRYWCVTFTLGLTPSEDAVTDCDIGTVASGIETVASGIETNHCGIGTAHCGIETNHSDLLPPFPSFSVHFVPFQHE
jgi:hypothetical protein